RVPRPRDRRRADPPDARQERLLSRRGGGRRDRGPRGTAAPRRAAPRIRQAAGLGDGALRRRPHRRDRRPRPRRRRARRRRPRPAPGRRLLRDRRAAHLCRRRRHRLPEPRRPLLGAGPAPPPPPRARAGPPPCPAFGAAAKPMSSHFPIGIYAIPEVSMVGAPEHELTAQKVPYEIGVARYREIARGQILGDDSGFFKMLFHRETRSLLGVHILGTGATELLHIGQAVLAL